MKLPKTLLSAILIGIAVQTTTSCSKDKDLPNNEEKKEKKEDEKKPPFPYNCPACGMG